MAEELEQIQEVDIQGEPNPQPPSKARKLYQALLNDGYTQENLLGGEDNFVKVVTTKEGALKMYNALKAEGYNDDNLMGGEQGFVSTLVEEIPLEKKSQVVTETTSDGLPVGASLSTTNIPTVPLDKEGKALPVPQNPIDYSKNIFELEDIGDDASKAQAKKYRDDLKAQGYDADKVYSDFKDIDENIFTQEGATYSKEKLLQEYKENPQKYERDIANLKFTSLHAKSVYDLPAEDREKFQEINIGGDTPEERRANNKDIAFRIRMYGGKNEKELLRNFATIVGEEYGAALESPEKLKEDPRSKYLNEYQIAALQYLEDTNPEVASSYGAMMVDPKLIKKGSLEESGYQEKASSLEQIGLQLYRGNLNTQLQGLINKSKEGQLDQADINNYNELESKIKDVDNKIGEINVKYPIPADREAKEAAMDLTNNSTSTWYNRAFLSLGRAVDNTFKGIYDFATEPFRNDEENKLYQLATLGEAAGEDVLTYLPRERTAMKNYNWKISKDIYPDYKNIIDNKSLSADEKTQKVYQLLQNNPDKFTRIPYRESKIDINPTSVYYSVVDLGASLVPYIGLEMATVGGATPGIARKLLSSFTAAAATGFHDNYVAAIKEGSPNPYSQALVTTGIMSAAMAGAGTADMVKSMVGTKTTAGSLISKLSNDEIQAVLNKIENGTLKNKILDFGKSIGKDAVKSIAEGAKGGAKFEAFMAGGKILDKSLKGEDINYKDLAKEAALGVLNFTVFGGATGLSKSTWKNITDIQGGTLLKASQNPSEYLGLVQKQLADGSISREDYNQIKDNIELASKVAENIKYVNDSGKELSEKKKAQLLLAKMQEAKLNEEAEGDIPEKLRENLSNQAAEVKSDIASIQTTEPEQAYEYNGKQYKVKGNILVTSEGDLVPADLVDKIKAEGKLIEAPIIEAVDTEVIQNQMKPFTDKMVEIEREFKNNEYDIDWDYDNEIIITDKNGEQVDPEDLPEDLLSLAGQYEKATQKLGEFDQKSFVKALEDSRKVEETTAEEVKSETKELPEGKQAEVEKIRAEEQAELDSRIPNADQYRVDGKVDRSKLTNEEDIKAFDEVYAKYDKLIAPLLTEAEAPKTIIESKEEVIPMETEGEQPPFFEGGKNIVTRTGLTEEGRQKLIAKRNKETKVTERSKDEQAILDEINSYNSLKAGRLGKQKPEGLAQLNKIRIRVAEFNEKHGTDYEFDSKRGVLLNDNNRSVKRKTTEGKETEIDESGKVLRDRDLKTQEVFDALLEQGAMPTGYRADGLRMSDAQLDATVQDILDGVPSRRANNYLDSLENQIAKDDFDFSKGDDMPAYMRPEIKLDDVLSISKEVVTEPMTEESLNNWLETEAERTPENEEVYDNIDNLITEYETRNELEGEVQPTPTATEERATGKIEPTTKEQKVSGKLEPATEIKQIEPEKKSLADRFRSGKLDKDITMVGVPFLKEVWNGALETAARTIELTGDSVKAIKEAVKYIKSTDWYKSLSTSDREKAVDRFIDEHIDLLPKGKASLDLAVETEHPYLYRGGTEKRVSGLMRHMMESADVSAETKEDIRKNGIEYAIANNEEARKVASEIVNAFGEDDALKIAEQTDMHASVRSAIFAETIDRAYIREKNATTDAEKIEAAEQWKDRVNAYDKLLTAGGQFTAYVNHFYGTSPLGFVMRENENTNQRFNEWYKDKQPTYQELLDALNETAEGKAYLAEEVERIVKEERKQRRATRDKNIDDFFDKAKLQGGTYATVIPPNVWNGAMDVMKAAVKAGDRVADAVQRAIETISGQIGNNWDKEKFRKEYEALLTKVADADKKEAGKQDLASVYERRKRELERRIINKDFSAEEYKDKKTLTDKEKAAREEYQKVKELYDEEKKKSPEWQDKKAKQFLEKFRDRMKGLDEKQKEEVVRKSIKKLAETGALREDEFKKIVAETIGFKDLSDAQVKQIEDLTTTINRLSDIEDAMIDNPNEQTIAAYKKAKEESIQAGLDLYNIIHKKSDIIGTIKSWATGSLLSVPTLIKNVAQNIIMQGFIRFPRAILKQIADLSIYGTTYIGNKLLGSKMYEPTSNIFKTQKGYFRGYAEGIKRGWFNFKRGTQEQDYFGKTSYQSTLAPRQALRDLKMWKSGEKFLTKTEVVDRWLRSNIFARQADFILRGMGFGDRPQRFAAERAKAIEIGSYELKLTDDSSMIAFMESPQKMAYKTLIDSGVNKSEALSRSIEIEDRIKQEGSKAVLEEENLLSKASIYIEKGLQPKKDEGFIMKGIKGVSSVGKTLTFPFVKIPANVYWQMFKLFNPEVSVGQSLIQAAEAYKYAKKGENAKARASIEKSKDSMAMAALGIGINIAATTLISQGYIRSNPNSEDKAKVKAGLKLFGKGNQIDIGTLMGGKPYWVDLAWLGPIGAEMDIKQRLNEDKIKAQLKGEEPESKFGKWWDGLEYSGAAALNQLVFDQGARTVDAIRGGQDKLKIWFVNTMNTFENMFTGATYVAISKAMLPEEPRLRGDDVIEELKNNAKQRNVLLRLATSRPPSRISMWGDPIKKDNTLSGIMGNILGFEPNAPVQFGAVIYDDYRKTLDARFFPSVEDNKLTVDGKQVEITQAQKDELETLIGKYRKALVAPFISDCAESTFGVPVTEVDEDGIERVKSRYLKYSEIKEPLVKDWAEQKILALNKLYDEGKKAGMEKFLENHPEYSPKILNKMEERKKAKEEAHVEKFGAQAEKKIRQINKKP